MSCQGSLRGGGRLRWAGLVGLVAVLSVCLMPGVAEAKKDTVKVLSYNLYLGSDLADATNAGLASRTDLFTDEVGEVLSEVQLNNFAVRARRIAKDIKKQKVDLIGLQEASLWKIGVPTDGGGPPRGTPATLPFIDYIDAVLESLNAKAKTKKQCKKKGLKGKKCYRGYRLVVAQQEADVEQPGDFDNNAGPDGKTCDLTSGTCPNPYPSGGGGGGSDAWLWGNDDTPGLTNAGEPPAPQCSDGIDNDGDGRIDWGLDWAVAGQPPQLSGTQDEVSTPPFNWTALGLPIPSPADCDSRLDNTETPDAAPLSLPQDTNMDHHLYSPNFNAPEDPVSTFIGAAIFAASGGTIGDGSSIGPLPDKFGNGLDPAGASDCQSPGGLDTSADAGPSVGVTPSGILGTIATFLGSPFPKWDAPGFDAGTVPVCLFHGIDGDLRLQIRDVIVARRGAGVKAKNVTAGHFAPQNTFTVNVFGTSLSFTRGWVAADVNVRGKKFHLVNTHLESESFGSIREDQAAELVGPGGPATHPRTVLIGDLNSDPARDPTNLPHGDGGSNIAINRVFAAGFVPAQPFGLSGGHGELLNDLSNTLDNGRIDHILTNNPSVRFRGGFILDSIGGGLWASDHGGVLSRLAIPGGKKKGKNK